MKIKATFKGKELQFLTSTPTKFSKKFCKLKTFC